MTASSEPDLATPAELHAVRDALAAREPIFHRPEFGCTRADFERMLAADYWEVGASGLRYSRAFVLDRLERRPPDPTEHTWTTRDIHCRALGADTFLITYTLDQAGRISRRSTLWRRHGTQWLALFHQGTLVAD